MEFDDDFRTLVLMFPHDALDLPPESVAELTAVRIAGDAGIGRIISPFMVQLADNLELLSGPSGHRLAHNAVDLLATLFDSELHSGNGPPQRGHHSELLARIRQHIEANLGDPELYRQPSPQPISSPPGTCTAFSTTPAPRWPDGSAPAGSSAAAATCAIRYRPTAQSVPSQPAGASPMPPISAGSFAVPSVSRPARTGAPDRAASRSGAWVGGAA